MLRIIKKWYFKLYHLFRFLGIFILIFGLKENIYAEEVNECYQNYVLGNITIVDITVGSGNENLVRFKPSLHPVNSTLPVYIKFFPKNNNFDANMFAKTIFVWNSNVQTICQDNNEVLIGCSYSDFNYDSEHHIVSFKYRGDIGNNAYFGIKLYKSYIDSISSIEGTPLAYTQDLNNFLECETEEQETSNIYSNFLNLYTEKIEYLANGFTTNPYLLAMISIIFSFIILEITIKLFNIKGGRRK